MSRFNEIICGKVVDRDSDHLPVVTWTRGLRRARPSTRSLSLVRLPHIAFFTLEDVVCQDRFLDVSACAEKPAAKG
jgi:hypothetical protein